MQDATFHLEKGMIHPIEMEIGFTLVSNLKYKTEVQICCAQKVELNIG